MYQYFNPYLMRYGEDDYNETPYQERASIKLTRAFVPDQPYIGMFPLSEALKKGVLFPNLFIPFPIKSIE